MSPSEVDSSPDAPSTEGSYVAALRRTALRTAREPVLLVLLAATAIEFTLMEVLEEASPDGILELLAGAGGFADMDLVVPLVLLILPFVTAFRMALFRPARAAYRGESLTLGESVSSALNRMFPVLVTSLAINVLLGSVVLLCLALDVRMPLFTLLPLQFALTPALYFAATRDERATASIRRSLSFTRRHWYALFASQGARELVLAAWTSLLAGALAFPNPGVVAGVLAVRYVGWLVVTSTYLHLDDV